jgi:hypothetical protein
MQLALLATFDARRRGPPMDLQKRLSTEPVARRAAFALMLESANVIDEW